MPMEFFLLCLLSLGNLATFATGDDRFAYSGFTGANLTLDGTATVTPEGLLVLTNGTANLIGHAINPTPLHFRRRPDGTVESFSVSFVFGIQSINPDVSVDGMAFFVSRSNNFSNAFASQFLGLLNDQNDGNKSNHIFAVELDTFQNTELQDINDNHVGIDINSLHSKQSHSAGFYEDSSGAFKNLSLNSGEAMRVWVSYDGGDTQINVTMAPLRAAKPARPLLSLTYNLSAVLIDPAYIGFSSATGPVSTRYFLLGWSFSLNSLAPDIDIAKLPKLPRVGPKPSSRILVIITPISTAVFIITMGTIIILLVLRRRRYAELREDWEVEFGPHRYKYKDLYQATEGFRNKHLLGVGGFGKVYKGVLPGSKLEVAVKVVSHDSRQGMKEFITEVVSIGRLRHRNLVPLLGYCRRKHELILVYDYMPNGSLDKYLYHDGEKSTLDWAQRFQIIRDIARGLLYLHEKWEKVVIHRDIKASNILLDINMNGRLGDFGLARLYDHGSGPQTTRVVGTIGYIAPEMVRTGKASPLTDVFAFGMFLLEVSCGRRPFKETSTGQGFRLVDFVLEHWHNGSLMEALDTRLQGHCNVNEACLVFNLALLCLHPVPNGRPSMRQAMQYLDGDTPLPELAPMGLSGSMPSLMQDIGFSPSVMSYPTSFGTISSLSGGR
ncbi:L-type lectin-domain containing receptor kinase SIT2-like [Phragmites australis]|uniref:L-type lectin-domain containing receptor kinase SIT2-like n=1 Tax=Phragmites australis TaxID=29695 RepID=UPI002D7738F1|nr:L-type lectin-domain containing receptor kinase SIT2-like [Phragmites australis]